MINEYNSNLIFCTSFSHIRIMKYQLNSLNINVIDFTENKKIINILLL